MRSKSFHSKWPYCRLELIYTLLCLALVHGLSAGMAQDARHATVHSQVGFLTSPHQSGLEVDAGQKCAALQRANFATILDAATEITSAAKVKAGAEPAFCQVWGIVHPQVEFEIRLPLTTWNGKFFETGCAAMCGVTYIDSLCPESAS